MGNPDRLNSTAAEDEASFRQAGVLWLVLLSALIAVSLGALIFPVLAGPRAGVLPVNMAARSQADYSADPLGTSQAPLQVAIIGDVLRDIEPGAQNIGLRLTSVFVQLQTPLPTGEEDGISSTPKASEPSATAPSSAISLTSTVSATIPGSPSATETRTSTVTTTGTLPTASPSVSPTPTPNASPTAIPSSTQTATFTIPPPTSTPLPPTPTSTSAVPLCEQFSLTGFNHNGQIVSWRLNNGSGSSVNITAIFINWPGGNSALVKIELAGDAIWDQGDTSPPTNITRDWKSGVSRSIGADSSKELLFQYEEPAGSSGYNLRADLDNGCRVND